MPHTFSVKDVDLLTRDQEQSGPLTEKGKLTRAIGGAATGMDSGGTAILGVGALCEVMGMPCVRIPLTHKISTQGIQSSKTRLPNPYVITPSPLLRNSLRYSIASVRLTLAVKGMASPLGLLIKKHTFLS